MTTIVQHLASHPLDLLVTAMKAPVYLDTEDRSFRIVSAYDQQIELHVRGEGLSFDRNGTPSGGVITGMVVYINGDISAQFIDCDISCEEFMHSMSTLLPDGSDMSGFFNAKDLQILFMP